MRYDLLEKKVSNYGVALFRIKLISLRVNPKVPQNRLTD